MAGLASNLATRPAGSIAHCTVPPTSKSVSQPLFPQHRSPRITHLVRPSARFVIFPADRPLSLLVHYTLFLCYFFRCQCAALEVPGQNQPTYPLDVTRQILRMYLIPSRTGPRAVAARERHRQPPQAGHQLSSRTFRWQLQVRLLS